MSPSPPARFTRRIALLSLFSVPTGPNDSKIDKINRPNLVTSARLEIDTIWWFGATSFCTDKRCWRHLFWIQLGTSILSLAPPLSALINAVGATKSDHSENKRPDHGELAPANQKIFTRKSDNNFGDGLLPVHFHSVYLALLGTGFRNSCVGESDHQL